MLDLPNSVDNTITFLKSGNYLADRSLSTALYLSLSLKRPLFLEGEAGVGKTEIAKVLSDKLGRKLLRLQCYEGLDIASAVYEWNYSKQMIEIRMAEAEGLAPTGSPILAVYDNPGTTLPFMRRNEILLPIEWE